MTFANDEPLSLEFAARHCTLTEGDKDRFRADLAPLARVVDSFPSATLHVEVAHHPRTGTHEVKLNLVLARSMSLYASDEDEHAQPAFKRCVRSLLARVQAFKARSTAHERQGHEEVPGRMVRAPVRPDVEALEAAARQGDYQTFREVIAIYRESLRKRVGRRIELQPEAAAKLGDDLGLDECVEEVFLNAFESFDRRPAAPVALGEWLETLIDESIWELVEDPETVRRNVSFLRSALGADDESGARP